MWAPASASNDIGTYVPDNTPLYRGDWLTSVVQNAVGWVIPNQLNPTDLNASYTPTGGTGDVWVYDANFYASSLVYGGWKCLDPVGTYNLGSCTNGRVRIDTSNDVTPYSTTEARSLLCEEMGHSVGLGHRFLAPNDPDPGCMSQDWTETNYTSHDVNHLNTWY